MNLITLKIFWFKLLWPLTYFKAGKSQQDQFKLFSKIGWCVLLGLTFMMMIIIFGGRFDVFWAQYLVVMLAVFGAMCKDLKKKHQTLQPNPILQAYEEKLNYLEAVLQEQKRLKQNLPQASQPASPKRL